MKLTKNQKIFAVVGVAVVVLLFVRSSRKKDVPSGNSVTGGSGGNGSGSGSGYDYDYLNPNAFPLKVGSRGTYVKCLQNWLNMKKDQTGTSRIASDGVFGTATLAALKKAWKYYYGYETNEITRADFSREGMSAFDF